MKPIIAITHGDTNGIGYEVIIKTFAAPEMLDICTPIIYGSPKVAKHHIKELGLEANFTIISSIMDFHHGRINLIPVVEEDVKVEFGKPSKESGSAALKALEKAMEDFKEGLFEAIVTAPINASSMQCDAFKFNGHTDYMENRIGEGKDSLAILMNQHIRIALATTHSPMSEISKKLTTEYIEKKVETLNKSLKQDFLILQPRIAVLSLNPKANEDGTLGKEEQEIIAPAIKNLMEKKIMTFGPFPAADFFEQASYEHFDAVLAMYHDQGVAPLQAFSSDYAINYTAGLPIIRTSPDCGVSYEIAGKNEADEQSFRQAVYAAIDIMRNRKAHAEAYANPIPKLFHERRDEGERLRFNIPTKKQKDDKQNDKSKEDKAKQND
ncbi:MAG: 4-hydroxythreonine-4-phosphate dehydrogenase PdxA [Bacteroidaceae bacterium]|nr:4-hydroxythreonine-4-phosphate dehydrogenase PdxA [Bacteroidaceae bacterium]